jgi:hypothetical protein
MLELLTDGCNLRHGCKSPFKTGFSLRGQSQLTPSRFLHNRTYITTKCARWTPPLKTGSMDMRSPRQHGLPTEITLCTAWRIRPDTLPGIRLHTSFLISILSPAILRKCACWIPTSTIQVSRHRTSSLGPNSVTTRVYGAGSDVTVSLPVITPQTPINGRSRCVPL